MKFLLFPGLWLVKPFPTISAQTACRIELKFMDAFFIGLPSMIDFWSHSAEFASFILICPEVCAHFWTNHSGSWSQARWVQFYRIPQQWIPLGQLLPFNGLLLVTQFLHMSREVAQCVDFTFVRCHHYKQGLPFLKIITYPTSRILKFFDLLIWNKEEKSVQIHLPDW